MDFGTYNYHVTMLTSQCEVFKLLKYLIFIYIEIGFFYWSQKRMKMKEMH